MEPAPVDPIAHRIAVMLWTPEFVKWAYPKTPPVALHASRVWPFFGRPRSKARRVHRSLTSRLSPLGSSTPIGTMASLAPERLKSLTSFAGRASCHADDEAVPVGRGQRDRVAVDEAQHDQGVPGDGPRFRRRRVGGPTACQEGTYGIGGRQASRRRGSGGGRRTMSAWDRVPGRDRSH